MDETRRVRELIKRLTKGEHISTDHITTNLNYVADVLDTIYDNETKRLCDEDDDLSEVETQAVPSQVRDWLTMTFTRSQSSIKPDEEKRKFRSVANVIRVGILVEKIYRRMSTGVGLHVPANILQLLKNVDDWSFDVFQISDASTDGHVLKYIGYEIIQKHDLINKFRINSQTLDNFLLQVETGYGKYCNPYHNQTHAADVTQTTHHVLSQTGLIAWLSDIEVFATLVAAIIHDYEHTGTTNAFHVNTGSDIALLYNDRNVLENHHASAVFKLMKDEEYNILSSLKPNEYKEFRQLVIEIVLATDMSLHFQQIKTMKSLINMPENIDKCKALSLIVHCADISHPAKTWDLHSRWTDLLVQEFFRQGDREAELSLPISPLCDRKSTMVAESQIGFIEFIVDPSFTVMSDAIDKIIESAQSSEPQQPLFKLSKLNGSDKRSTDPGKVKITRHWNDCLLSNKRQWKEKAQKTDAESGKQQPDHGDIPKAGKEQQPEKLTQEPAPNAAISSVVVKDSNKAMTETNVRKNENTGDSTLVNDDRRPSTSSSLDSSLRDSILLSD